MENITTLRRAMSFKHINTIPEKGMLKPLLCCFGKAAKKLNQISSSKSRLSFTFIKIQAFILLLRLLSYDVKVSTRSSLMEMAKDMENQ